MLHALNACRVMAEFAVVSYHVGNADGTNLLVGGHGVSQDLMSFFFVLSGFVAAHSRPEGEPGWDFFRRRARKTYPLYLVMLLAGFPGELYGHVVREAQRCSAQFWGFSAAQLGASQSWLAWGTVGSNNPSWYFSTLLWVWAAYALHDPRPLLRTRPLAAAAALYLASLGACLGLSCFDSQNTKQFPPLRLLEFWMGCAVACSVKKGGTPLPGVVPASALALYAAHACLSTAMAERWDAQVMNKTESCDFWQRGPDLQIKPGKFVTATSPVWAAVIHWLATAESRGEWTGPLQWDAFRHLSAFSLQVYLVHAVVWDALRSASDALGTRSWWAKDWYMLACYAAAYAVHTYVQPVLDRLAGADGHVKPAAAGAPP
jgi:peptidoglycan/LPS O-acetylase OafA/YrhL